MQPFEVVVEECETFAVVRLCGDFDLAAAEAVETALLPLEDRFPTVFLDLQEVSFLDSTGLRALVSADARSRRNRFELKIVRGPETVQTLLYVTGLAALLPLVDASELPRSTISLMKSSPGSPKPGACRFPDKSGTRAPNRR